MVSCSSLPLADGSFGSGCGCVCVCWGGGGGLVGGGVSGSCLLARRHRFGPKGAQLPLSVIVWKQCLPWVPRCAMCPLRREDSAISRDFGTLILSSSNMDAYSTWSLAHCLPVALLLRVCVEGEGPRRDPCLGGESGACVPVCGGGGWGGGGREADAAGRQRCRRGV